MGQPDKSRLGFNIYQRVSSLVGAEKCRRYFILFKDVLSELLLAVNLQKIMIFALKQWKLPPSSG